MSPWFSSPHLFGAYYGAIAGSLVGVLGGLLGTAASLLAPQGKGRRLVLGTMTLLLALGLLHVAVGLVALLAGQPYAIWYPLLLVGVILSVTLSCVFSPVRATYDRIEARKLDAAFIRNR